MNLVISILLIVNISLYADLLSDGLNAYDQGKIEKAMRLLNKACSEDEASACFKLAEIYKEGEDATEDRYTARDFYRMSCDLGLQDGCKEYRKINETGRR